VDEMDWQFIVALIIAIPVIIFVPVLVWIAVASGLFQAARDSIRRRATARRKVAPATESIRPTSRES
jgi:hypothetical protein